MSAVQDRVRVDLLSTILRGLSKTTIDTICSFLTNLNKRNAKHFLCNPENITFSLIIFYSVDFNKKKYM